METHDWMFKCLLLLLALQTGLLPGLLVTTLFICSGTCCLDQHIVHLMSTPISQQQGCQQSMQSNEAGS